MDRSSTTQCIPTEGTHSAKRGVRVGWGLAKLNLVAPPGSSETQSIRRLAFHVSRAQLDCTSRLGTEGKFSESTPVSSIICCHLPHHRMHEHRACTDGSRLLFDWEERWFAGTWGVSIEQSCGVCRG